jgi:mRNA-degrading endonuclease YafQ of YafQ-DinJ toxin-antitoxin module
MINNYQKKFKKDIKLILKNKIKNYIILYTKEHIKEIIIQLGCLKSKNIKKSYFYGFLYIN